MGTYHASMHCGFACSICLFCGEQGGFFWPSWSPGKFLFVEHSFCHSQSATRIGVFNHSSAMSSLFVSCKQEYLLKRDSISAFTQHRQSALCQTTARVQIRR